MTFTLTCIKKKLIPFIYIIAMGWAFINAYLHPYYNWDMLCYMGSVISWSEKDPAEVHRKVMETAKAEIPDWVYVQHAANSLSSEYSAFMDQVPLCQIKPLYTVTVWLVHQMGVPLAVSTWRVSNFSFLILAIVMYLWKPMFMHRNAWLLLVLGISYLWEFPLGTVGNLSTPDAMSTMLCIFAFYAWLQKRSIFGFCILGVMATLARPDAMIIMSAATVYFAFLSPKEWRWSKTAAALMLVALLISYSAFKMAFGGYTFAQYFIHSLVATSPHPGQITQELTPSLYWFIFTGGLQMFFSQSRVITLALIAAFAFFAYYLKPYPERRLWVDLLALTLVSWATRFILWPSWGDYRFYYTYSVMLLLTSGEVIAPFAAALWKKIITLREADIAAHRQTTYKL
jgi:hypothetical protein